MADGAGRPWLQLRAYYSCLLALKYIATKNRDGGELANQVPTLLQLHLLARPSSKTNPKVFLGAIQKYLPEKTPPLRLSPLCLSTSFLLLLQTVPNIYIYCKSLLLLCCCCSCSPSPKKYRPYPTSIIFFFQPTSKLVDEVTKSTLDNFLIGLDL